MALVDASGRPVASEQNSYRPQNMTVIVGMVNKISQQPEYTFQIIIPMEQFEFYMANPQHFTLTVNNFVGYAYGTQILGEQEASNEQIREWTAAVSKKYSVALSEPLAVDSIFRDTSTAQVTETVQEEEMVNDS